MLQHILKEPQFWLSDQDQFCQFSAVHIQNEMQFSHYYPYPNTYPEKK